MTLEDFVGLRSCHIGATRDSPHGNGGVDLPSQLEELRMASVDGEAKVSISTSSNSMMRGMKAISAFDL